MKTLLCALAAAALFQTATVYAYDGTHCKEAGVCWEPKPGYPDKVAGSKYDPKHDPNELDKQGQSIKDMEARNEKRWANLSKTGKFVYDVEDIK